MSNEERIEKLEDEVASLRFLVSLLTESDTRKTELLAGIGRVLEKHTEILAKLTDITIK